MPPILVDPLVSVIIPSYNARKWIRFTLESVSAQTLREIEVLVVDDGSTDGTGELAEEFAKHDSRVRVIRQVNAGVGAARNAGIRAARGRYIAPLDADDLWDPAKLQKQVACMERLGERVGMVYCDSWHLDESGTKLAHQFDSVHVGGNCRKRLIYFNFLGNASVPLFRSEALSRSGLYLTRQEQHGAQGCEDWDLALRVAEQWQVAPVPERLVGYRQVATCMSAGGASMTKSFKIALERARDRNRDLPSALFNWSEARFHRYIFRKCFNGGDYLSSFLAANRAIKADRLMLLDPKMQRMMLKCLWFLTKERFGIKAAPMPPALPWRPVDRVCIDLQKRLFEQRLKTLDEEHDGEPPGAYRQPPKVVARTHLANEAENPLQLREKCEAALNETPSQYL